MRTRYSRTLRIISAVTLTFFSWTFLSLWQIPAAIAAEKQKAAVKEHTSRSVSRERRPEEKFEGALEALRENVSRAGKKADRGEDDTSERDAIRTKKAEIEALDLELRKEFDATEQRLKTAKLPKEILARHTAFVEHYTSNINSLKKEIDDIDKAKTKADRKANIEKARLHLEKTQSQKKHIPLDPNRLPHRQVRGKEKAPRLKKEEFERDFPKQKSRSSRNIADNRLLPALLASKPQPKPVVLAFNETASDMPFSLGVYPIKPQIAFSDPSPIILAQAIDQPAAEDLLETPEVQFTDAIRAKAQELGGSPVRIYEWVRSNIEYAPTYGSISGADQCLQSRICNDMDTASLLIALLRVSGIYAHYVYGTVEIPIDKAMNLVGGVTNPNMVATIFATNGVPVRNVISGGTIKAVQIERVTVSAFIDYIPSRGAVHRQGDTWIPLDASFKQYNYTQGIDIASAVPFDAQTFANLLLSTATTNTVDGSVTNVNSAYVQQSMQDYQTQVQNYIQQNYPNAAIGDVIGKKEIKAQVLGILPLTLPYNIVQTGSEFAQVPDNLRETISFSTPDPTGASAGLSYITSMPQIAGKKITLSFSPATANDQAVIESLLPKPHIDGTPIQPSELPSSFPAYLINLKSELRIEGQVVATGSSVMMGSAQPFTMSLNEPGIGLSNIDNIVKIGEYFGIGVETGRIGANIFIALGSKLAATRTKLVSKDITGLAKDDLIGDLLQMTIMNYFTQLDMYDELEAKAGNLIRYRAPSIGMCSLVSNVKEVFGVPTNISYRGMMMDVDRIIQAVFSKDGNIDSVKQYMLSSGNRSSLMEHQVLEEIYSTPTKSVNGISAVKALQIANDSGILLYSIDQSNITAILPQLEISADVKTDILNAVNSGKVVTVSKTNIAFSGSSICGYIVIDPNSYAGAYMISSGTSGSYSEDSIPPGGLLIVAIVGLLLHNIATEAAAEEIEPAYNINRPPDCITPEYTHVGEYMSCIGNNFFIDNGKTVATLIFAIVKGISAKQHPMIGFGLAVLSTIALEGIVLSVAKECHDKAFHCDKEKL